MKRLHLVISLFILGIFLVSCGNTKEFDKVKQENLIIYHKDDNKDNVKGNLTFLLSSLEVEGVSISWESNKTDVIKITGSRGEVTRGTEDVEVELTATIKIGKQTQKITYTITVIKKDVVNEEFEVVFESNGGSPVNKVKVVEGQLLSKPADPTRNGYIFSGWTKDANLQNLWNFTTDKVTQNLTLYAKWEQEPAKATYEVTFSSNGGTTVNKITVVEGQLLNKPADPTKDKHIFIGWFKDEELQIPWNFTTDKVTQNLTLYAKWEQEPAKATYEVTFSSNGGTTVNKITVVEGQLLNKPADPTKDKHIFIGWFKDEELQIPWNFETDNVTTNLTLYAKWEKNQGVEVEVLLYHFNFSNTNFGTSYSSNDNTSKSLNNLIGGSVNVILSRAAANNNHTTFKDDFLVLSSGLKGSTTTEASVEFSFDKEIKRIEFDAVYWSSYDVAELTKFVLQAKVNGAWQEVFDIRAALAGSLVYKNIVISDLSGKEFRLYAVGNAPTGTGNNGGRVLIDNFKAYGITKVLEEDKTGPVINGAIDITMEIGDVVNFLDGVTALDNIDGNVAVTIESNNVDNTKAGEYTVVYKAVDRSGNVTLATIKVYVTNPAPTEGMVLEFSLDFNDLNATNGYANNNDTKRQTTNAVNNTKFDVVLSRGAANTKDGFTTTFLVLSAATKSTATDIAYAVFDFKKQISKIIIDTAYWSDTDAGQNTKYVLQVDNNGTWVDVADIKTKLNKTTSSTKLEFTNLNGSKYRLYAEGTKSSSNNGSRIIIDNLYAYTGQELTAEQVILQKDKNALNIPTRVLVEGVVTFPKTGSNGSTITWSYKDASNTNNSLIDFSTGLINVPSTGTLKIFVIATLKYSSFETTKEFEIEVGEGNATSIKNLYLVQKGNQVKTQGVITSIYGDTQKSIFIQDDQSGILVYITSTLATNLKAGDEITLIGKTNLVNGQVVVDEVISVNIIGTKQITTVNLTDPNSFINYIGKKVSITGLLSKSHLNTDTYVLINELATFDVVIPDSLDQSKKQAIKAKMNSLEIGVTIKVTGNVVANEDSHVLYVSEVEALETDGVLNLSDLEKVINTYLILPVGGVVKQNIILPTKLTLIDGITITWSSNNTNVISNTGVVTTSPTDVNVRLTYIIKLGTNEIKNGYIDYIVSESVDFTGYYASLKGLSGNALKSELTRIVSSMKNVSYDDARYILDDSDADPNKEGNVILIYNRASVSGKWDGGTTWNREHIWPQSKLGNASMSDLHNLKPANERINSSRGNNPFASGSGAYGHVTGGWFPGEEDKGDVARIVLYMNIRWGLEINTGGIGSLATFIAWHNADPVDDFEKNRNEVIYANQNNRNPFIDYPDLVDEIYGSIVNNLSSYKNDVQIINARMIDLNNITVVISFNNKEEFYA